MRTTLLAILVLTMPSISVAADPAGSLKPANPATSDKMLPVKGPTGSNACAAYGAGFVKIDGTDTCARIGGAVRLDARSSVGRR
jgi:hypothetical protein